MFDFDTAILGCSGLVLHPAKVTIATPNNLPLVTVAIAIKHDKCNDRLGTNPVMLEALALNS